MSRDIDNNESTSQEISGLRKEIDNIKQELKIINNKLDLILEMLNSFTLMVLEEQEDEDEDDPYDTEWVPEQEEDWNDYDEDE